MKKLFLSPLLIFAFLISTAVVWAFQPPPRKTLAERLDLASNVIIGTAKTVRVVEFKDGKLQEVQPQPPTLNGREQIAEIEIEVEEVLYPLDWKPKKTVRYFFGGGFFGVNSIRSDTVGKKHIYLMRSLNDVLSPEEYEALKHEGELFIPSYEWRLADAIEIKAEIVALLEARVKRETEAKSAKAKDK